MKIYDNIKRNNTYITKVKYELGDFCYYQRETTVYTFSLNDDGVNYIETSWKTHNYVGHLHNVCDDSYKILENVYQKITRQVKLERITKCE